jgi:phage head maturation protease
VFDSPSRDLGGFREVVRPQAVARRGDVVALFNHDPNAVLGRTPATLRLETDARGLAFTLDPAPMNRTAECENQCFTSRRASSTASTRISADSVVRSSSAVPM